LPGENSEVLHVVSEIRKMFSCESLVYQAESMTRVLKRVKALTVFDGYNEASCVHWRGTCLFLIDDSHEEMSNRHWRMYRMKYVPYRRTDRGKYSNRVAEERIDGSEVVLIILDNLVPSLVVAEACGSEL